MEIVEIDPRELKPAEYNPRKLNEKQIKDLTESVKEFGLVDPIIVNSFPGRENIVIGGHQRLKIAILEGFKTIPVVYLNLDEKRERELNLRLNKNLGEWDWDMLANFDEEELLQVGFTSQELDKFLDLKEDEFNAEEEYNAILETTVKEGDLYQLGEHKLLCGDSTKEESFSRLMGNEKAQMIFTDPPYNVGYDYNVIYASKKKIKTRGVFNDKKRPEEFLDFIALIMKNCFLYSKDNSPFYLWYASKLENFVREGIEKSEWYISQTIIWLKERIQFSPGQDYHRIYEPCYFGWKKGTKHFFNKNDNEMGKWGEFILLDQSSFEEWLDVLYARRDLSKDYIHPTQKPIRLAEHALKKHSNQGDVILEPFNGSGSTMMACEGLKRKCYAIELDPKFVEVAIKRWEKVTGQTAIKMA